MHEGAARWVRPILMTTTTTVVAVLPIMLGAGTGSETMRRIAAPMVGWNGLRDPAHAPGIPVLFALLRGLRLERFAGQDRA